MIIDKMDGSDERSNLDHKSLDNMESESEDLDDKEEEEAESEDLLFGNGGDDDESIFYNATPEGSTVVEVVRATMSCSSAPPQIVASDFVGWLHRILSSCWRIFLASVTPFIWLRGPSVGM